MTQLEIKKKIDENNKRLEQIFDPTTFVLNEEVAKIWSENNELRQLCAHEFDENGMCIYCYSKEEEYDS